MTSAEKTFEGILEDFKTRLTAKELQNFQFVTLNDVRETAIRIQNSQEQLKEMRHMKRLESFLEAMDQFGKVIEVFVNASGYVAFVWGPMKFILQIASTWTEAFELLLDAYSQIGEHMPLLEQYKDFFGDKEHMIRVLALLYVDILEFHRRAIRFFSGKGIFSRPNVLYAVVWLTVVLIVWQQIFRSVWKDFGTRFKQILDSLSRHKQLIREQAELLHVQQSQSDSQGLIDHIQQYERDREAQRMRQEQQAEADLHEKYLKVSGWFSASPSTTEDQQVFSGVRSKGSGDWVLKDPKVSNWIEPETPISSMLWLSGKPGAGKTILASIIIEECLKSKSFDTFYFYCKENDSEKNDCVSIYRGLLQQMLNNCRELIPYCYDKLVNTGELNLTTTTLAQQLLRLFCEKIPRQYVIIDGLDEVEPAQRKLLLSFLSETVDRCDERDPGKLRVMIVSQEIADIQKFLQTATTLKLTAEHNEKDIRAYVCDRSEEIQEKYELEVENVEDIQESTCVRSDGMFLYAKLVMEHLHAMETKEDILDEIRKYGLPDGLEEAYERIVRRLKRSLKPQQWTIACKLLGWMVCAKRPLTWREIQAVVSMDTKNRSIDLDKKKLRSHIRDYCGSLIEISDGDRVELVHTTAKKYVISTEYVHKPTVEVNLAALCLQYLTFECFTEEIDADTALTGILAFQDYAVAKWTEHIRVIVKETLDESSIDKVSHEATQELEAGLADFAGCYDDDLQQDKINEIAREQCIGFENYPFFDDLLCIWNYIHRHDEKGSGARDDISIKTLHESVFRNRKLVEEMTTKHMPQSQENKDLTTLYGSKRFKCPKIRCYYFHEGFKDPKTRDQHINRHDRPFSCVFPDCSIAVFGFSSNKDLERHRRFFHPEMEDEANMFAVAAKPLSKATYECDMCGKKFTRGFHRKNHMRSHTGERPFPCSECGKAFTRANDCRRHEKIHAHRG